MVVLQNVTCPVISLADAVSKIRLIYDKEHTHPEDKLTIAKAMKYGNLHGTSYAAIASLIEYGLLERATGDKLKVSADALEILLGHKGDPKRVKAIQKAAFASSLFGDLYALYGNTLPSNTNLVTNLTNMGLHHSKVGDAVRAYRGTIEFVNEETKDSISESLEELNSEVPMQSQTFRRSNIGPLGRNDLISSSALNEKEDTVLSWRIAEDCEVQINFKGRVTKEALQKLVAHLQLSMDDFPSRERVEFSSGHQDNG